MASCLLLFIVLCSYYYTAAHGGEERHGFVVVPTSSFEPEAACSTSTVNQEPINHGTRSVAPLVHRHGPCAPPSLSSSKKPSMAETLRRNRDRGDHLIRRASNAATTTSSTALASEHGNVSVPTYLGTPVDSLEYAVTVGIGTPPVQQVVLIDTGSDLSWVQCQPCNASKCYAQKDPLFDPRNSSTYARIPCHTAVCRRLVADRYWAGCTGPVCNYFIQYGDGSRTNGIYSTDSLTLVPGGPTIAGFRFGCGYDQRQQDDRFDGLLGLGGAPESFPAQTVRIFGGAFSYCLPPVNSKRGFLALGAPHNTTSSSSGFVFTPMGRIGQELTSYVVHMIGISVGGKPLDVPATAFRGGMFIDSGQIVTRLQTTPYNALTAAFRHAMRAYPRNPHGDLDTCYNFTGYDKVTVPTVAFTFAGGVTVELDVPNGVLLNDCLAFEEAGPDIGLGIIGNVNQRTLEVLYDVDRSLVGFRTNAC